MPERDYIPLVASLVKDAESYRDVLSADRIKQIEYFDGKMTDTPSDAGRSSVVSRDVRATVQKVLPSLTRVFLGSEKIVEFQPAQQGDERQAEQATDYMNSIVFIECNGPRLIEDTIHDCLKTRNAVVEWEYEEKQRTRVSTHRGLWEDAFNKLVNEEGVEVLEHSERVELVDVPAPEGQEAGQQEIPVHDCKIRRTITERKPRVEGFPLEQFLIHPDALEEDSAPIIGRKRPLRRTDLVAMGYDKNVVDRLPKMGSDGKMEDAEEFTRKDFVREDTIVHELEEIDYYSLYVRIDQDEDGIAELRHMCFGGKISSDTLLMDEEADEVQIAIIKAKAKPHQWEGVSIADDMMEIQRINTVLLRQTMDNLYWQNNQQLGYRADLIEPEGMAAVTNPQFGQSIPLKPGASAAEALQPIIVPFMADKSFAMIEYMKGEGEDRTGITDASGGLPPDALQNVTAKASALMEQQGIGQADLMARTLALGFRRVFRGLLRLIIKYQDKPRTVRLRNEWVEFDPRQWNADMDCVVNTGLGAGTRERDMMVMGQVLQVQREVLAAYGPQNPFVTPNNLANTLFRLTEAAGLRTPDLYFSKPSDEQVQAMMQPKPNPEAEKLKVELAAQKELKAMELEHEKGVKNLEMQANAHKEVVQSRAAVEEAQMRAQIDSVDKDKDRELQRYEIDQKMALEWAKLAQDNQLKREGMDREDTRILATANIKADKQAA